VISSSDITPGADSVEVPLTVSEEYSSPPNTTGASMTPPEVFTKPGESVPAIDLMETPKPLSSQIDPMDEEQTPRASSAALNRTEYTIPRTPSKNGR